MVCPDVADKSKLSSAEIEFFFFCCDVCVGSKDVVSFWFVLFDFLCANPRSYWSQPTESVRERSKKYKKDRRRHKALNKDLITERMTVGQIT